MNMILSSEVRELAKQILLASITGKQLKPNQITEDNIKQAVDSASYIVNTLSNIEEEAWNSISTIQWEENLS